MQQSREKNVGMLTECIQKYFGNNILVLMQINNDNGMDFQLECILYRSFLVRFCLADVMKGGVFSSQISFGKYYIDLSYLLSTEDKRKLSLNFDKDSINKNLNLLDKYMWWRMTDAQKETFTI